MEEELLKLKKSNNRMKAVIVILLFTLVLAGLLVFLFCCGNKEEAKQAPKQDEKKEENTKLYHIVDGDEFEFYNLGVKNENNISFDYPQLDINTDEVKKINDSIKSMYEKDYNELFTTKNKLENYSDDLFLFKKNEAYYGSGDLWIPEYSVVDEDKYIYISFTNTQYCKCSGSTESYSYFIDKNTKKVLTKSEIVKLFNLSEQEVINTVNNDLKSISCLDENDRAKTIDDISFELENNKLTYSLKNFFGCSGSGTSN